MSLINKIFGAVVVGSVAAGCASSMKSEQWGVPSLAECKPGLKMEQARISRDGNMLTIRAPFEQINSLPFTGEKYCERTIEELSCNVVKMKLCTEDRISGFLRGAPKP